MFRLRNFFTRLLFSATPSSNCVTKSRYSLARLGVATCTVILLTYLGFGPSLGLSSLPYRKITAAVSKTENRLQQAPLANNTSGFQHTRIPNGAHVHGFTMLDNIYLRNGTFYVVTADRSSFPPLDQLLSRPVGLSDAGIEPTDEQLQFINPEEAPYVLGPYTWIEDFSVVVYDSPQFMKHFYHWFGEIILGAWRVYSHLLPDADNTHNSLPFPRRFILPFIENEEWRDRAGMDGPLMRAAFPAAAIEQSWYWKDLMKLGTTVVFDRIMLVNRYSAHKHPFGGVWYKMIAGAMNVTTPDDFWAPVRASVWQNALGFVPDAGVQEPTAVPLITYISRQSAGRRLVEKDHDGLVTALRKLEAEGICSFEIARMERMSVREQLELVSRSTVKVGVHGNGLTWQLFMPPSPHSTIIEILIPKGYTFDYEILARNMGHRHYAVWNDSYSTYDKGEYHKGVQFPNGFHEIIPVHGPTVANIIRNRLSENTRIA
ncbi:hypothetical protein C8R43DRAFT_923814 [Mycena crocata]|nr:hypothetical protein C8R43DRAFT_923814 [Mycena crocata]